MRPIFFTLLFLSSFAFGQGMTEEMACADAKGGKGTVVDSNSSTPLAGAKVLIKPYGYGDEIKEALIFNKNLLMENFIVPNGLKLPLFRNILENYYT